MRFTQSAVLSFAILYSFLPVVFAAPALLTTGDAVAAKQAFVNSVKSSSSPELERAMASIRILDPEDVSPEHLAIVKQATKSKDSKTATRAQSALDLYTGDATDNGVNKAIARLRRGKHSPEDLSLIKDTIHNEAYPEDVRKAVRDKYEGANHVNNVAKSNALNAEPSHEDQVMATQQGRWGDKTASRVVAEADERRESRGLTMASRNAVGSAQG